MSEAGLKRRSLIILLVEDDKRRWELFDDWCPEGVHLAWAESAGVALGMIKRDAGRIYSGVLLDHDLQMRKKGGIDGTLCGQDVVLSMIEHLDKDIPILVHSMNPAGGAAMVRQLETAGFVVTRSEWAGMTKGIFDEWLEEVFEGVE